MIGLSDVQLAYNQIKEHVNYTPVMTSSSLNKMLDAQVFFKRIGNK